VICHLGYDWAGDRAPGTPLERTVIYELHVRAFTAHASSGVRHPGTFAGLAEKARWLRELGVTAVQLMPVAEFDETDNPRHNPLTDEPLLNVWGYAPLSFMAPRTAYAAEATAAGALREFRDMVRVLHAEGLEVLLDVVFNQTGESGPAALPRSWRGLDRAGYFVLDARGRDQDHTGTGHTFACARPVAAELILEALRFWAVEMHVDGFRFDLASTLRAQRARAAPRTRRSSRARRPALRIEATGAVGHGSPGGGFRITAASPSSTAASATTCATGCATWAGAIPMATRLGLADPLPLRVRPHPVTSHPHDGFTLATREPRGAQGCSGEAQRDGTNDHRSWNSAEGLDARSRRAMRARQARNAAALLLLTRRCCGLGRTAAACRRQQQCLVPGRTRGGWTGRRVRGGGGFGARSGAACWHCGARIPRWRVPSGGPARRSGRRTASPRGTAGVAVSSGRREELLTNGERQETLIGAPPGCAWHRSPTAAERAWNGSRRSRAGRSKRAASPSAARLLAAR
jgi:glycogen operon protein